MGKRKESAPKLAKAQDAPPKRVKRFRIELGWRGLLSVLLVSFCLFLWMFLLGLWAGQTILFPLDNKLTHEKRTDQTETPRKIPAAIKVISAP